MACTCASHLFYILILDYFSAEGIVDDVVTTSIILSQKHFRLFDASFAVCVFTISMGCIHCENFFLYNI